MKQTDPVVVLKALIDREGGRRNAAKVLGIGEVYIGDLLRGHRPFSARVLARLGLRSIVVADREKARA